MIGLLLSIGIVAQRFKMFEEITRKQMTNVIINITFPAMLISTALTPYSPEVFKNGLIMIVLGLITRVIIIIVAYLTSGLVTKNKEDKTIYTYFTSFSNIGFVGIPICLALFGKEAGLLAALFCIPHEILTWSLGVWMLKKCAGSAEKFNWKQAISMPSIFSVLSLIIYSIPFHNYPKLVTDFFYYVGTPTTFLGMLLLGSQLYLYRPDFTQNKTALFLMFFIKMIIFPITVFFTLRFIGFNETATNVATIVCSMPPPSTAPVIASRFGVNSRFGGTATIVLTLLMLLTLPLILFLIHNYDNIYDLLSGFKFQDRGFFLSF
jgi:malate permease and related proteins